MRKLILVLILAAPVVLGQTAQRRTPEGIGFSYLAANGGIATDDLSSIYLAKEYTTAHNGVTHLTYRQRFQGIDVYNAAWIANISKDGVVLNSGGQLFPTPGPVDLANQVSPAIAVQAAVREVNSRIGARYLPLEVSSPRQYPRGQAALARANTVHYAAGELGGEVEGKLVWYAHRGSLLLAWLFNVVDEDGVSAYNVAVETATDAIIDKQSMTFLQSPRGFVFDQGSPQPNPTPGARLTSGPPIVERSLLPLTGDPTASPMGWIVNNETAGYNTVVGENLIGLTFASTTPTKAANDFIFPLSLGPLAPNPLSFPDAANVNMFYWVNRIHDLHYAYGFNEAAGNYQSDNYGRGGIDGDPMLAYSHFGAASQLSPQLNNAFFTTRSLEDGNPAMIAMFINSSGAGGFFADSAYSAITIAHEYTHGVSFRLLPNGYGSFQTASMGEAWSDFFGLEYTLPEGSPTDGIYPYGEYSYQSWGLGIRTRPYSTRTDINPLTYSSLGHVIYPGPEVHADGEIWVEALWDARAKLIQQFGETEGRRRIRQLVMDGLKLSPPSPSMVDARDAILLADRVDFNGDSQTQLWEAFAKRGLGALAHSDGGDTLHVVSSFEVQSSEGKLKFYEDTYVIGETVRVLLSDADLAEPNVRVQLSTSSGDIENLILRRVGSVYFESMFTTGAAVSRQNGVLNLVPGDTITASYTDATGGSFGPFSLGPSVVRAKAATQLSYSLTTSNIASTGLNPFPNETRLTAVRSPIVVNLPFDFPFFSKKYRSMAVFPNGMVSFEPSVTTSLLRSGCTDAAELRKIAGIAPLFANLNFGTVQPNEGVFMSTATPNTVSIRWAAETVPQFPLIGAAIPEPVNVAVTIGADGAISLLYGSGNANLHTAIQTLSTCGAQPIVGISPGHDTYGFTFNLRTYTNAPTLTLLPPINPATAPEVILERPTPNETVKGVMRVSGIAYEPGVPQTFLSRRDIFIDNIERTFSTTLVSRPDFCATRPVIGCPNVGFQADLNLQAFNLAPGAHTIFVRASNTRGAFKDSAVVSFNVDAGTARLPKGAIEAPAAGAELSGTSVAVRGYAYADDLRVLRVDFLVDGVTIPGIAYGIARTDVCAGLSPVPPNCPNVGWTLTLNTRTGAVPLTDGAHSMQLRVLDELGRFTLFPDQPVPFTVKNGPLTFPTGAVTSIKPNDRLSGIVSVSGYAYAPVGRVLAVLLLIDGSSVATVGPATYGLPRPDDCAALPSVPACPNIGFNIGFDTRTITNGTHVLGVLIVSDSGTTATIPRDARNGMNVTIDNK